MDDFRTTASAHDWLFPLVAVSRHAPAETRAEMTKFEGLFYHTFNRVFPAVLSALVETFSLPLLKFQVWELLAPDPLLDSDVKGSRKRNRNPFYLLSVSNSFRGSGMTGQDPRFSPH